VYGGGAGLVWRQPEGGVGEGLVDGFFDALAVAAGALQVAQAQIGVPLRNAAPTDN
jgi:hypothetical protein